MLKLHIEAKMAEALFAALDEEGDDASINAG